ncbi:MAG: STAS domain-containing protein [Mycobacterium sp.]|nr:STAS domain-containing protein [Mycobacterium sp.]
MLTISGEIDLSNSNYVQAFAIRYVLSGNPLALDLSGVDFFAVQGLSMLMSLDATCRAAKVPWRLVSSYAVGRILQLTACTTVPTASSVAEALRQITALSHTRRRVTLAAPTTAPRQVVR